MVQVAQEKADLTEQSELLAKQIEKEEEELASLEQVKRDILMLEFKNSNESDQNYLRILINPIRILQEFAFSSKNSDYDIIGQTN